MAACHERGEDGTGRVSGFFRGALGLQKSPGSTNCPRCGYPLSHYGEMKAGDRKLFRLELCGLIEGGRTLLQPERIKTQGDTDPCVES